MQCQRRIILVGKTGYGKSSTANSILQRDAFIQKLSAKAVTKTSLVKKGKSPFNNLEYDVVDTPGLFDTEKSVSERALEIQRSVDICPEPHAFLLVFSANYCMRKEEKFTIDLLRVMFGECIFNHSIVVVTHGKEFESDLEFKQFLNKNAVLVKLIELCGNRVAKIENTNDFLAGNEGTKNLLEMIEGMSVAGKTVYRYTGLKTHRSVIEEHSKIYNGRGSINEEVSAMVKNVGKKLDKTMWKAMLYGEVSIGSDAVGEIYTGGPEESINAVAASGLESTELNSTTALKARKIKAKPFQRRIILVGKSGNGKSSTANSILQRDAFINKIDSNAVTQTCSVKSGKSSINNLEYDVVDTPGLLDLEKSVSERALEIQRSVDICPEPHAFLIVLRADIRMTTDEKFTIDMLRIMFGECIFNHSVVAFSHGNVFESDLDFQEFWKKNTVLVKLVQLCGNRVAKIENTNDFLTDNEGTKNLLEMIERVSDAGKTVYRYAGLKTHRSAIEEHSKNYHGEGNIQEELSEMVIQIGKEIDKEFWKKMLYGGVLIGGALGVGYAVTPAGAVKAVEGVVSKTAEAAVNTGLPSRAGAAVMNSGAVVGEAVLRTAGNVFSKIRFW